MKTTCRWRRIPCAAGLGLFEFTIVVMVFSIFVVFLLKRLDQAKIDAEQFEIQWTIYALNSSMKALVIEANLPDKRIPITKLTRDNPIELLARKPGNYIGEYDGVDPALLPEGKWYFDNRDKVLVYLLKHGKSFAGGQAKMLKFKVKLLRLPESTAKRPGMLSGNDRVFLEIVQ
jgi:general secretion pathway protein G